MRTVILAAGRGSRLGDRTANKPKLFLQVNGKTVYEYQRDVLDEYTDDVTVVLGHGFENANGQIDEAVDLGNGVDSRGLYLENWQDVENAASLERALREFEAEDSGEHVLVVCGDVLFSEDTLEKIVKRFQARYRHAGYNAVGCIEGIQDEMTAVRYDDEGVITDYGAIEGHQEVGLFVLHNDNIPEALETLEENPNDWFPIVFTATPSKRVTVPADERHEINTPEHLAEVESGVTWQ